MNKFLVAPALLALAAPAFAADLPSRREPPAPLPPMPQSQTYLGEWTGLYGGLNIGGLRADTNPDVTGYTFGARVGYDWQHSPEIVFGVLADLDVSNAHANAPAGVIGLPRTQLKMPWAGSVNARIGYLVDPTLLLYISGGYTYSDVKVTPATPRFAASSADGYNIGVGLEYRFAPSWAFMTEYRYHSLKADVPGAARFAGHVIKIGLNYRFSSVAPVVARF